MHSKSLIILILALSVLSSYKTIAQSSFVNTISADLPLWMINPYPNNFFSDQGISILNLKKDNAYDKKPIQKISASLKFTFNNGMIPTNCWLQIPDYLLFNKTIPASLAHKINPLSQPNICAANSLNHQDWNYLIFNPFISFLQESDRTPQTETGVSGLDLSTNTVSLLKQMHPDLDGANVSISLKESQFNTTDIDLSQRIFFTGFEDAVTDQHASIMATLIAGAGNSGSKGEGGASGANITGASFDNLLPEPINYYSQNGIRIQNHSYGVGIEPEYGLDAAAYDQTTYIDSNLIHVFSAGNSGGATPAIGKYAGITGWGNMTGSFKMSKNSLSLAATDTLERMLPFSSRGPAYDGRIKPELAALGQDGTSGAAAICSGVAALLGQQVKEKDGFYPPAHLLKALLINGSDDTGEPGPDYIGGYGLLNAYESSQQVKKNTYKLHSLSAGESFNQQIILPANTSRFSMTVSWTDIPAQAGTSKALVNDLDLWLISPNGDTILPWVLNAFPHPDSLTKKAIRQRDTLNNTEQISLINPAPGVYTIRVVSGKMSNTTQRFALAWNVQETNQILFHNPLTAYPVNASEGTIVRWHSSFPAGTKSDLSLKNIENGAVTILAQQVDLSTRYYVWHPTSDLAFRGKLYFQVSGQSFESDSFVVNPARKPQVGYICNDSVFLFWNKLQGIDSWQIQTLQGTTLQNLQSVQDTIISLPIDQLGKGWVSVTPIVKGKKGARYNTIQVFNQGIACFVKSFLADYDQGTAKLSLELGTLYSVADIAFQKKQGTEFTDLKTFTAGNPQPFLYTDPSLLAGTNRYRAAIKLQTGQMVYSREEIIMWEGTDGFNLYPNPVIRGQKLYLQHRSQEDIEIIITDITGRPVMSAKTDLFINEIQTGRLASGLYFLQIFEAGKRKLVKKFLVQ